MGALRPSVLAPGRLTRRAEFLAAAAGRRFHTGRMTVQGLRRAEAAGPVAPSGPGLRVGFTITKRVGHATERNRIRRRLRVAVRALAAELPVEQAAQPFDLVVVARREALGAPFALLVEDLGRAVAAVTRPGGSGPGGRRPRGAEPRRGVAPIPRSDTDRSDPDRSDPPSRTP